MDWALASQMNASQTEGRPSASDSVGLCLGPALITLLMSVGLTQYKTTLVSGFLLISCPRKLCIFSIADGADTSGRTMQ